MRAFADIACATVIAAIAASSAAAQERRDAVTTGRDLALQLYSGCHLVTPGQRRPIAGGAPSFQEIARRPESTEFALRNVMRAPHPIMPTLILSPDEADDIIAYILSLKRGPQ